MLQDAARKKAEDAAVEVARQSGRYVDVAVHSFITEIPPSRLAVPEDATINFLRRQIQYRVEVRHLQAVGSGQMLIKLTKALLQIKALFGALIGKLSWAQMGLQTPGIAKQSANAS